MDSKKALKVVVDDGWGENVYKIQGFSLTNRTHSVKPYRTFAGDTLSNDVIKSMTFGDIYHIDAIYIKDGKEYHANPIKFVK